MSNNVVKTEYGYEIIWTETDDYAGKLLVFETSFTTPINFFKNKNRSWFINNGNFRVRWIDTTDGKLYQQDCAEGSTFFAPALMPVSLQSLGSSGSISEVSNNPQDEAMYTLIPADNIGH
jgi:hypothetical protein